MTGRAPPIHLAPPAAGGQGPPSIVYLDRVRWLRVRNDEAEDCPPGGLLRSTGSDDEGSVTAEKPDQDSQDGLLIAHPDGGIPSGGYGLATYDEWVLGAYETGTPALGEAWGSQAGSWYLHSGKTGYRVVSDPDGDGRLVEVVRLGGAAAGTTTTTREPCTGSCTWEWDFDNQLWTVTAQDCGGVCVCQPPLFCGGDTPPDGCTDLVITIACARHEDLETPPNCFDGGGGGPVRWWCLEYSDANGSYRYCTARDSIFDGDDLAGGGDPGPYESEEECEANCCSGWDAGGCVGECFYDVNGDLIDATCLGCLDCACGDAPTTLTTPPPGSCPVFSAPCVPDRPNTSTTTTTTTGTTTTAPPTNYYCHTDQATCGDPGFYFCASASSSPGFTFCSGPYPGFEACQDACDEDSSTSTTTTSTTTSTTTTTCAPGWYCHTLGGPTSECDGLAVGCVFGCPDDVSDLCSGEWPDEATCNEFCPNTMTTRPPPAPRARGTAPRRPA